MRSSPPPPPPPFFTTLHILVLKYMEHIMNHQVLSTKPSLLSQKHRLTGLCIRSMQGNTLSQRWCACTYILPNFRQVGAYFLINTYFP